MNGCQDNIKCTPTPPYQKSQNVALVFVASLLGITVPFWSKFVAEVSKKDIRNPQKKALDNFISSVAK